MVIFASLFNKGIDNALVRIGALGYACQVVQQLRSIYGVRRLHLNGASLHGVAQLFNCADSVGYTRR